MPLTPLRAEDERVFRQLRNRLAGELLTDDTSRYLYGTDASYHLIVPRAVARPRHTADLAAIAATLHEVNSARDPEERIPVIMRSGGTSLTGGPIGDGLVVDVTKYFHAIVDFDPRKRRVRVQPGVTYDELSAFLRPHGLMFPPNPASGIACELGGMWANNASGTRHVKYGPTRDWVKALTAVTAAGETFHTHAVPAAPDSPPRFGDAVQSEWAAALWPIVRDQQEMIQSHTPKVTKNASGYALDRLWANGVFDLTQLLIGSEGTLALFAEAELALAEEPPERAVALLFFESWEDAGHAVNEVLPLEPVAVEMVDRHLLDIVRPHSEIVRALVPEQTETALLVEFEGDDGAGVREHVDRAIGQCTVSRALAFAHRVAYDRNEQEQLWAVRKSAAMVGHMTDGKRKPVPFIEDCVVPPEKLPAYIRDISRIFEKHQVHVAYWGHAGNGNMHVRPALDLTDPDDLRRMREITDAVFAVVDSYGGSYTAEHGDGYTHAHYVERKFGPLYPLFEQVKATCDPLQYLNPGKILSRHTDPLTSDLRMGPRDRICVEAENPVVHNVEAMRHVENCVGLGVCKSFCPSFIGLRNEQDLTRGRTDAMRGMMTGAFGDPDRYLLSREFQEMGDTCLNCKRCAHQCPSQVDEPRHLLLARRYRVEKQGMPFLEWLLAHYERFAPWGVRFAVITNFFSRLPFVRALLEWTVGIDRRRVLPRFAGRTLDTWFARRTPAGEGAKGKIIYFPGCFARYNEPQSVGRNVVEMCELLGYRVVIPATRCSGHALETYGGDMTPNARHNIEVLEQAGSPDAPILTSCSSCRLSLIKQYPEWFEDDQEWGPRAQAIADRVHDAAYFGAQYVTPRGDGDGTAPIAYHAPCHELMLAEMGHPGGEAALRDPRGHAAYHEIEQHCSGMGGTFGFKRKNRTITETNANVMVRHLEPIPEGTCVTTDCPSCRLMLEERSGRPADHPVNLVYAWLKQDRGH